MNDLISVVVPVYNTGEYLRDCVNSILEQDYQNIEILLVDDGSTDNLSSALCDEISKEYNNIRVIHQQNCGSAGARNRGVQEAKGKYISFVDSDDVIESNMLSTLYSMVEEKEVKVALCGMVIENNKKVSRPDEIVGDKVLTNTEFLHYFFLGSNHSACTSLYHKSVFEECKFPLNETNEDYIFNFEVFIRQDKIAVTDKPFYHYVKREGSNTTSTMRLRVLHWLNHVKYVKETMDNKKEFASLSEEVNYQYLYCNVILCNSAVLNMANSRNDDAVMVYNTAAKELKKHRDKLKTNRYLSKRNRLIGMFVSYFPNLYRIFMPLLLKLKG
ncbi:MAG: glycosyltransferase [Clostridia bacterium]|nr:glycosyltransferase [Clostridia bacterium]